jgi:hypothetical protein
VNHDFVEMLSALSVAGADYLLVGAHALAAHGRPRATGDLDIWLRPTPGNATRVWAALLQFGAPLHEISQEDLSEPDIVFQIGISPSRIDLLTSISGVDFESAWRNRITINVSGLLIPTLGKEDLIRNKLAAGRPRDIADIAELADAEPDANA